MVHYGEIENWSPRRHALLSRRIQLRSSCKKESQQCSHRPWSPNKRRERARELVSSNLETFTDYLRTFVTKQIEFLLTMTFQIIN